MSDRFSPGDRVRTSSHDPAGHTRLPRYARGAVGMALSGKDTGGSQWFVTHSPQPHLDGGYTVFGRVTGGMEVVDRMTVGDRIRSVTIIEGRAATAAPGNSLPARRRPRVRP